MILQALDRYYDRMAARGEAQPPGWAKVGVEWTIVLSKDGEPVAVGRNVELQGKKARPKAISVPAPVKRTVGIAPNTLWDKTAYVLGRTAGEGRRTAEEHAAFKQATLALIGCSNDEGLVALRRFLETWTPDRFDAPPFRPEMLDGNVVFQLDGEEGYVHDRPAAKALLGRETADASDDAEVCLITGQRTLPMRLHPTIKGVNGAQSSGASLVSFNLDAFKSYGRDQGANAPTSEVAGERYGAALNAMLDRAGANRLKRGIGEATVVFWADTSEAVDEKAAEAAERVWASVFEPVGEDDDLDYVAATKVEDALKAVAEGRPQAVSADLKPGTRFHILGLSPNAARLSVRFWQSDTLEAFAGALGRHLDDLRIEPSPWPGKPPAIWRLLLKTTALQEKFENVPPLLAGELTRAVLTGAPYPRTWLTAAITRLRAGDKPTGGWHAAAIKACINRNPHEENLPVALDPTYDNIAYQLGRLFAVIEAAQYAALGRVNATVADRFYASASSTPARVFPSLLRGARTHVSDAKKRGSGGWIERKLDEIVSRLPPSFPTTLRLEDQGRFAVGYYHERASRAAKADSPEADTDEGELASAREPQGAQL